MGFIFVAGGVFLLICAKDGLLWRVVNLTGEMRFIKSQTRPPSKKCKAHLRGTVEVIRHVEDEQRIQIVKGSSLFVDVPS